MHSAGKRPAYLPVSVTGLRHGSAVVRVVWDAGELSGILGSRTEHPQQESADTDANQAPQTVQPEECRILLRQRCGFRFVTLHPVRVLRRRFGPLHGHDDMQARGQTTIPAVFGAGKTLLTLLPTDEVVGPGKHTRR